MTWSRVATSGATSTSPAKPGTVARCSGGPDAAAKPKPLKPAAIPGLADRVELGGRPADPPAPTPAPPVHHPQPGSDSIGDPYYPNLGNGGYEAQHYTVDLSVDMDHNQVRGTTTMDATATQDLSSFNLDLAGFDVGPVTVNGQPAAVARKDEELTVTPAAPINHGDPFEVAVGYSGQPVPVESQAVPMIVGWKKFDGGVCVESEPEGAHHWIPVNDHPRNKATYTFRMEVPKGLTVAANGTLVQHVDGDRTSTFVWDSKDPMASYLATVQIGNYTEQDDTGPNGLPIKNFFPPAMAKDATFDFGRVKDMIALFSDRFGPYPFERYGNLVVPQQGLIGGALECQTMSIFDPFVVSGDRSNENVIAHELGHQWFGDHVSVKNWKDIFLAEGFATFCEWLWTEHTQGADAYNAQAHQVYDWLQGMQAGPQTTATPECVKKMLNAVRHRKSMDAVLAGRDSGLQIGAPPPNDLFDELVYIKGALTLYALRVKLGDGAFYAGLKAYQQQFANRNAEIADLQSVMEAAGKQDLKDFFNAWLYSSALPPFPTPAPAPPPSPPVG